MSSSLLPSTASTYTILAKPIDFCQVLFVVPCLFSYLVSPRAWIEVRALQGTAAVGGCNLEAFICRSWVRPWSWSDIVPGHLQIIVLIHVVFGLCNLLNQSPLLVSCSLHLCRIQLHRLQWETHSLYKGGDIQSKISVYNP